MATIFNTITTISGRVTRILNFMASADDFYVAIAKPTPWDASFGSGVSDTNPPSPTSDLLVIPEPILYKKVCCVAAASRARFCTGAINETQTVAPGLEDCGINNNAVQDSTILIQESFTDLNFSFYSTDDIKIVDGKYNIQPEFVYVKGEILGEEYIEDGWRASGLFTKLVLADGVAEGQTTYTNAQVVSGILQQMTYNTFVERQDGKIHRFEYLINV